MQTQFQLVLATTAQDYQAFKELLQEYATHDLDDSCHSTIWTDMAQLPGRYAPPSGRVLLAYQDAQIAACGALVAAKTAGMTEIKRVYVRPNFRRLGLAREMTKALTLHAQEMGYQTAAICTWAHNTQALNLYQQMGFTPIPCFRESSKSHLTFLGLPLQAQVPN
jgi:ribosomal protein S18 acetylase RimI-like enzyme